MKSKRRAIIHGLDPRPSDASLIAIATARASKGKASVVVDGKFNGITLGKNSPLLVVSRGRGRRASSSGSGRIDPTDRIDPLGRMNGAEYLRGEQLEIMRGANVILAWFFGAISLQLAPATWYRPDFLIILPDLRIKLEEIKGHWEDDARAKIKIAARLHPWFEFCALVRKGEQWRTERVLA